MTGLPVRPLHATALATSLDVHCELLRDCRRCAHAAGIAPITSLARAPRALLVGQAPGRTEAAGGLPFAGRAGVTLFNWLASVGISEASAREWFYIAAITRCYPGPHPSGRGDRVPSPRERHLCGDWLDRELALIRPSVIVLVGRLAAQRFLRAQPLDAVVGREHEIVHAGGRSVVIPLPHPSGASSWTSVPAHRVLLTSALDHIRRRLAPELPAARGVA